MGFRRDRAKCAEINLADKWTVCQEAPSGEKLETTVHIGPLDSRDAEELIQKLFDRLDLKGDAIVSLRSVQGRFSRWCVGDIGKA